MTDATARLAMVDVSDKPPTVRRAVAEARVVASPDTLARIRAGTVPKGDPLAVARVAGVMAAKRTAGLLPLCHPLPIDHIAVDAQVEPGGVRITAAVATRTPTGPEMEALTAAAVAALTIYDMCKGLQPDLTITGLRLLEKEGGQSGHWTRGAD